MFCVYKTRFFWVFAGIGSREMDVFLIVAWLVGGLGVRGFWVVGCSWEWVFYEGIVFGCAEFVGKS